MLSPCLSHSTSLLSLNAHYTPGRPQPAEQHRFTSQKPAASPPKPPGLPGWVLATKSRQIDLSRSRPGAPDTASHRNRSARAEVALDRQAQALCAFTAPFIPVFHSTSANIDQTSSAPLPESHKSLRVTERRTKAQRDLRLNPTSFKQGNSSEAKSPAVPRRRGGLWGQWWPEAWPG